VVATSFATMALCGGIPSIYVNPRLHVPVSVTSTVAHQGQVVRTLEAAQAALRLVLAQHNRSVDIVVRLAPGQHRVPKGGLMLAQDDSPAPGFTVTWAAEDGGYPSVISGGENVTGWMPVNDPTLPAGVYKAPIPSALLGGTSRQLYIDGVRATRTSVPASTALPDLFLEDRPECEACSYAVPSAAPLTWSNPSDIEFVYSGVAAGWAEPRCAILSIGPGDGSLPNCTVDAGDEADCGFTDSTEEECTANKTASHPFGCCWHEGGVGPSGHWCIEPAYPGVAAPSRITMQQPCMWNLVNR
jgi:hypothetical protein